MSRKDLTAEPFIMHKLSMRHSIAWRSLPDNARRVLDVLEQRNCEHGGRKNGKLPCTYDDFVSVGGLRRQSIALAVRQCVELGFLEITFHAKPSVAEHRRSSEYRLTYIFHKDANPHTTDEWKRISTEAAATAALARAAETHSVDHKRRASRAVEARNEPLSARRSAA